MGPTITVEVPVSVLIILALMVLAPLVRRARSRRRSGGHALATTAAPTVDSRVAQMLADPNAMLPANYMSQRGNEYRFLLERVHSSWRAYILHQPSYGSRDASGARTHRLSDNGRLFVCWDRDVATRNEMMHIAKMWAELTDTYIATGVFPTG